MKKFVLVIRSIMLIYLLIIFPFFYFDMPIRFLLIDSFLGYVPIEFYFALRRVKKKPLVYVFGFLYLLFLPNNAYLLTDLIHLSRISFYTYSGVIMTENSLRWLMFALVIIGIFGLTLIGFQTEISVIRSLKRYFNWSSTNCVFVLIGLFVLVSCGVFLGRFLRLNSIQIFTDSTQLLDDSIHLLTIEGLLFILLFTLIQVSFLGVWQVNKFLLNKDNE